MYCTAFCTDRRTEDTVMPNLVTHALFCDDVLSALDNPLLSSHRMLFLTGGQGPDFLFFHHSDPLRTAVLPSDIRKYGRKFHADHINDFYLSALSSIQKEKDPAIRNDLIAYVCGHLCHWALDSTVHPLIYSRTGNCQGRSAWMHHRFESLLDAALLMYKKKQTILTYFPGDECFSSDLNTARAMARIYVPAIETIYGEKVNPHSFAEVLQDWKRVQKRFYDPHNRKRRTIVPLEKTFGMYGLMSGFAIPYTCEDNVDICNLLHDSWRHPVTGEERKESVLDLMNIALDKAVTAIQLFLAAVDHPENPAFKESFCDFLGDRNYEMDLPGNPVPVFFDLKGLE